MDEDIALFKAGHLSEAIKALNGLVKANGSNCEYRSRLVEYLCVANQFEKADKHLEVIASLDPKTSVRVSELRQILRAAKARSDLWLHGRSPEFLGEVPGYVSDRLRAIVSYRDKSFSQMRDYLMKASEGRPAISLMLNEEPSADFRDLDDFVADVFEIYTPTGKYIWAPIEHVVEANFTAPKRPMDVAWKSLELTMRDGTSGVVYMPNIYVSPVEPIDDKFLMGRETEWAEHESAYRGAGLRCFMSNETSVQIHEIDSIRLSS